MTDNIYFHLIVLIAGFTQGFTGFGSALIMLPLLTLLIGVKTVVPMVILLGLCINVVLLLQIHRHLEWKRVRVLFTAAVPGIFSGVYILKTMSTGFLELAIGGVLIVFPCYLMSRGVPEREIAPVWVWPVGFLSGVLGGSVSAGGPPVIIYTAMQPWGKLPIKSTLVGFFLLTSMVTCVVQAASGFMTREVLVLFAGGLPALVTGVLAGSYLFDRIDSGAYRKVLNVLLILLGVFMVGKAIVGGW
jgi:uncharacterized membrane protein YfcA